MIISIDNPVISTYIFFALFSVSLIIFLRKRKSSELFSTDVTQELKGLAILAVVFSHIGFFLIAGHQFLFPLSTIAGVGVNLFLFLSGYGLVASMLKNNLSIGQFYKRRLIKLLVPFWLVVTAFFLLDFFILHHAYRAAYIIQTFLGYFPQANLYNDFNSPLWYITFILFYYFIFPLVFYKKMPWLSAIVIYVATYFIVQAGPSFTKGVWYLYNVHLMAFPLGMLISNLFNLPGKLSNYGRAFLNYFSSCSRPLKFFSYYGLVFILLAVIGYTTYYSNIGGRPFKEDLTSLITMLAIIGLFIIKKVRVGFLYILGVYSFEIYLLHWPILYRYDLFYRFMPSWLATVLYLVLFLLLGIALNRVAKHIFKASSKNLNN